MKRLSFPSYFKKFSSMFQEDFLNSCCLGAISLLKDVVTPGPDPLVFLKIQQKICKDPFSCEKIYAFIETVKSQGGTLHILGMRTCYQEGVSTFTILV